MILDKRCQIIEDGAVIVGVSGGPDSLSLLHLLHASRVHVIAVHVNHQLRDEANGEEEFVKKYCSNQAIPFVALKVNVREHSLQNQLSEEESARILRYRGLFQQAEKARAQAVMVAHNADDQVETILMHFLRGAGLNGLRGMEMVSINDQWSSSIPLIRPLLETSRNEILAYCQEQGLEPTFDLSNEEPKYYRNRIRNILIPQLLTFNPQFKARVRNMSELISLDDDFISQVVEKAWNQALIQRKTNFIEFWAEKLIDVHPAILKRIMRKALKTLLPGQRDIDFNVIQRVCDFLLGQGKTNHLSLLGDIEIFKYGKERILLCSEHDRLDEYWPQIEREGDQPVDISGLTSLNPWWQIEAKVIGPGSPFPSDRMNCLLDLEMLTGLKVGVFQDGDRFSPYGLQGKTIKLGDYWTNTGLPQKARRNWPIIKTGSKIVWIPGFQIGDEYQVTQKTKIILSLQLIRKV
ncbi:MAG: tRNA lysidine(34) synthetase TilS [Chloroflexi bacterium]|nr:tRNA lysidine(34) synthetase TilS [Chloroflexota bacterium]